MKRLISILMIVVLVAAGIPAAPVLAAGGQEYIYIRNTEDLLKFSKKCNSDSWSYGKTVVLTDNLDLTGIKFEPVQVFAGTFDGNNHTISGVEYVGSGYAEGFFRFITADGTVKNLTVCGSIESDNKEECTGGICGVNAGKLVGCTFRGVVNGKSETGGIAGENESTGSIRYCYAYGSITGYDGTGGIVGRNFGTISSCCNNAGVNSDNSWLVEADEGGLEWILENRKEVSLVNGTDIGGIAGFSKGLIEDCTNCGVVGYEHNGYNIGGIAGRQSGQVLRCVNEGKVYGRKDVGGIVGQMEPFIHVDEAQSLSEAVQELHDRIEKMLDDIDATQNVLDGDFDDLRSHSDHALDQSRSIMDQLGDFAEQNVDSANELMDRIEYVVEHLPEIMDQVKASVEKIDDVSKDLEKVNEDLDVIGKLKENQNGENEKNRLSGTASVGGSLRFNSMNPKEGSAVTITVRPDAGYELKSITAKDSEDREVVLDKASGEEYTFLMPQGNVAVKAEFGYVGKYIPASNAGGVVAVSERDGRVTVTVTPHDGYTFDRVLIGNEAVQKADFEERNNVYQYSFDHGKNGQPFIVLADFYTEPDSGFKDGDSAEETENKTIRVINGTGGVLITDKTQGAAGDKILLKAVPAEGYRMETLHIESDSTGEEIPYVKKNEELVYEFEMPEGDVRVLASYKPVTGIVESNAGGTAFFEVSSDRVILKVQPDAGYTLTENPAVTDKNGTKVLLTRQNAGSYYYEIEDSMYEFPVRAWITFEATTDYQAYQDARDRMEVNSGRLEDSMKALSDTGSAIEDLFYDEQGNRIAAQDFLKDSERCDQLADEVFELTGHLSQAGEAAAAMIRDLNTITGILAPYLEEGMESANEDIRKATEDLSEVSMFLQIASELTEEVADYLNAQPDVEFSEFEEGFREDVDGLFDELDAIKDVTDRLGGHMEYYPDLVLEDFRGVNDQLNDVVQLVVDKVDNVENLYLDEDPYEDVSEEDIEGSTDGKVSDCRNRGDVAGNVNVGGIAGAMAIDEEDPEDNAAGAVDLLSGNRYMTKCIISECRNEGAIQAKKDGVGGIVGFMRLGIVNSCKAYGSVESTEGEYIGGVCGQSLALIQNCWSLVSLNGSQYVGGVAGYGTKIRHCNAMAVINPDAIRKGAIAGWVESEEDERVGYSEDISGNYYVSDTLNGVDHINYVGVAEPVTYMQMLSMDGTPVEFQHLHIDFVADGKLVERVPVEYGQRVSEIRYPAVPVINGSYGEWEEIPYEAIEANITVEAEYFDSIMTLKSVNEGQEKAFAMADGIFEGDAQLYVVPDTTVEGMVTYNIGISNASLGEETVTRVRILNPYSSAVGVECYQDGAWVDTDYKTYGQYLEVEMKGVRLKVRIVEEKQPGILIYGIGAVLAVIFAGAAVLHKRRTKGKK